MRKAVDAIRILSVEAIEKAKSGHPGLPLGAAPIGYTLFSRHLSFNPKNPNFFNRDRFVMSAGHGSALVYALLHLFNCGITKEDLMSFRQLKSRTPGHPEYNVTPFVEASTGPLGQGFANAVGFAMAEKALGAKFNKDGLDIVDHYTYVLCGDGCMQEGIQYEAASIAGTWGLGKLICIYDSNDITIEGDISVTFTEDVAKRHEAQGWHIVKVNDGNDIEAISAAILLAKDEKQKPSLIIVKTQIGYGSPKAGTAATHGAPLGEENLAQTKEFLGWNAKPFEVPADVTKHYLEICEGLKYETEWNRIVKNYKASYPEDYEEFLRWTRSKAPDLTEIEEIWDWEDKKIATRSASEIVLNKLADLIPNLIGGSADLGSSNKTILKGKGFFSKDNPTGRNIYFGIREHAMSAISNGIALHGGFFNFCSTFFVFSDYMKNGMRMSALMKLPVTYILSHDSIGVGEDGPTHHPVEQLVALRSMPNMTVFRPCDGKETAAAYVTALNSKGPCCIITSRQDLDYQKNTGKEALMGGYILVDSQKETPDCILIASGSEVEVAIEARNLLLEKEIDARVVSMPCMEIFDKQTLKYKESVLPLNVRARVAIEAGSMMAWAKYVGLDGAFVTMDDFGASAPPDKLFLIYGFTPENVASVAKKVIKNVAKRTIDETIQ